MVSQNRPYTTILWLWLTTLSITGQMRYQFDRGCHQASCTTTHSLCRTNCSRPHPNKPRHSRCLQLPVQTLRPPTAKTWSALILQYMHNKPYPAGLGDPHRLTTRNTIRLKQRGVEAMQRIRDGIIRKIVLKVWEAVVS